MIETEIRELVKSSLTLPDREPDKLLHASMDISDSLRHVQLRYVGAPTLERHHLGFTKAVTGTLWHNYFTQRFRDLGWSVINEISLKHFMPYGWSGTADWIVLVPGHGFVLLDLKTTSDKTMPYIPKPEHVLQISAYHQALAKPLNKVSLYGKAGIIYLPLDTKQTRKETGTDFSIEWVDPINVTPAMVGRWNKVADYVTKYHSTNSLKNDMLAPVQTRVQKLYKSYRKNDTFELKLAPHWSTAYCPFPVTLCDCSLQKSTKIGEYRFFNSDDKWVYYPRKAYTSIEPTVVPKEVSP